MSDNIGLFLVNDPLRHRPPYLEGPGCAIREFGLQSLGPGPFAVAAGRIRVFFDFAGFAGPESAASESDQSFVPTGVSDITDSINPALDFFLRFLAHFPAGNPVLTVFAPFSVDDFINELACLVKSLRLFQNSAGFGFGYRINLPSEL